NNVVAGNYIGTDATGTIALSSQTGWTSGVLINGGTGNRIGADGHHVDAVGERNLISGNAACGVNIYQGGQNIVAGNYIGTDVTAANLIGNGWYATQNQSGVNISGSDGNRIGTDGDGIGDAEERNIISGNLWNGVSIGGSDNIVAGNYIGTDATGTL